MDARKVLLIAIVLFVGLAPNALLADTVDFDAFSDSEALTTQVSGITFTNAMVLSAGISLNEGEFPPQSGQNVITAPDPGSMMIDFAAPITSFSAYFTYTGLVTVEGFNASLVSVGSVSSLFSENYVSAGNPPNELIALSSAGGISRVVVNAEPGAFVLDTMRFDRQATTATVPEPGTAVLLAVGLAALSSSRQRLKRRAA